jgi:Tol biopolymer transport system component
MSIRFRCTIVLFVACLLAAPAPLLSQSASARFEQGLLKENAEGTLNEAIVIFRAIAEDKTADPAIRAKAQLHIGICFEKLGDAQARGAYERLIAGFPGQTNEVAAARARLAALKATPREVSSLPTLRLVWSGTDTDSSGEVSPDGRLLAYVNWDTGDLAVRDLRSGQSRTVTSKGGWKVSDDFALSPRWSPDGKRLAYFWYREEGYLYELRTTDLSGKNVRVLRSQPESKGAGLTPVGWYRDGTALLAAAPDQGYAAQIFRVSVDDAAISPVGKLGSIGASRVCLSPDGRYIAFDGPTNSDSLNMDVFVMPSSGGRAVPVVTGPYDDRLLAWTPDSRRILIASNRSGAYDAWMMRIDEGNAVGSPQLLRKDLGLVAPIGFSPDGAFYFAPDVAVRDVVLVDWNLQLSKAASAPTLATEHFSGSTCLPAWSPDGRKLAYLVDRGHRRPAETRRVRVRDIETGAERTLVDVSGSVYSLSWSPDGASIAMTVRPAHSPSVSQIVEVDSGRVVREIAARQSGLGLYFHAWAPDGGVVFYIAGGASRNTILLRRDLRTGDETPLYTGGVGVQIDVAVSPDGRDLAVREGRRIILMAATGGEPRELVRLDGAGGYVSSALAWSPDARHVYFGRRVDGVIRLYRVAVTGGAQEDLNLEIGEELRFRPDGRQLAFTRSKGDGRGEVWVLENFLPETKETPAASAQKVKK